MTDMPANQERPPVANMSTAIVIGVGGSGVQTLGRLRRALRDESRPDNTLIDNVHLLALDAVSQSKQKPPLPPGGFLAEQEFYNLVGDQPLNAYEYVKQAMEHTAFLQASWDTDYIPPNEPLTDGLKRSRGLGDLAFEINRESIEAQIDLVFGRALASNGRRAIYQDSATARLPVVIVASACGGTGASGFLHVLHAAHRLAHQRRVKLQVYPVVYLPRVFHDAVGKGQNPNGIRAAHRSNAYAFLAELELVLTKEGLFDKLIARDPDERISQWMTAQDIVSTAFLVDCQLSDGSALTQSAAYQIAADSLHSLLLTDSNDRLGIEGTNAGLAGLDDSVPPLRRAYGSFGAFALTYPGATYRRYLDARCSAALLSQFLLDVSANESMYGAPVAGELTRQLGDLTLDAGQGFRALLAVRDLRDRVDTVISDLSEVDDLEGLQAHASDFDFSISKAASEMAAKRPALQHEAIAKIDGIIDNVLAKSGEGVRVLIMALDRARQDLGNRVTDSSQAVSTAKGDIDSLSRAGGELAECREDLQRAWSAFPPIRGREKKRAAERYAMVAQRYSERVVEAEISAFSFEVLTQCVKRLNQGHDWMRATEKVLQSELASAEDLWRRDDLQGKDAGEVGQMLLVPSDVHPQVEESRIAKSAWAMTEAAIALDPALKRKETDSTKASTAGGRDWLRSFYEDLARHGSARGMLAIGAGGSYPNEQLLAIAQFRRQLAGEARRFSRANVTLPTSLEQAAKRADGAALGDRWNDAPEGEEARALSAALANLPNRILVPLGVDMGRMRLQPGDLVSPPLQVVAASGALKDDLAASMPASNRAFLDSHDPERVVATSALYGITLSAVAGIDSRYQDYRTIIEYRMARRGNANQPPPHIKRWLQDLVRQNPLVRRNYTDSSVASLVVRAVAISKVPGAPVTFANERIGTETFRVVYGQRTEVVNDALLPIGERVELGRALESWFDAIGSDIQLRTSIRDAFDHLLEEALVAASAGDLDPLSALQAANDRYLATNQKAWKELVDIANPDELTSRRTALRLALVDAGTTLRAKVLRVPEPPDDEDFGA